MAAPRDVGRHVIGQALAGIAPHVRRQAWAWITGVWDPATSPATSVETIHDACGGIMRAWSLLRLAL